MSDIISELKSVIVRAMGTCADCSRTDCETCINMNRSWIPDARRVLETATNCNRLAGNAAKLLEAQPVKTCDGLATMTLDEAIEHAEAKSDATPCGLEHAALAAWLRELRHYRDSNVAKLREALEGIEMLLGAGGDLDRKELAEECARALSAPTRNCDRFATYQKAVDYYRTHGWPTEGGRVKVDGKYYDSWECWLFAPATHEGGE